MIVETIIRTCPKCGSQHIVRNGRDYMGAQKYHCHDCGAYGTLDKKKGTTRRLKNKRKLAILNEPVCEA